MKKLFSLLLVIFLLPMAFTFSACSKSEEYKLSNLNNDLLSIADRYETVTVEDGNLRFDYSTLKKYENTIIEECVNNVEPYKNVQRYNQVFYNLMDFSFDYASVCSNDSFEINSKELRDIKTKLDNLETAIQMVDMDVKYLSSILNPSVDTNNIIYIERLDSILDSYSRLFVAGTEFTNAISDIYFNKILIDSNPNLAVVSAEEFESSIVINSLDARTKNIISLLTQNYIEVYVSKAGLVDELLRVNEQDKYNPLDLNVNDYAAKVAGLKLVDLTKPENVDTAVELSNQESRKQSFYELSIQAYNLQEIVENDRNSFSRACDKVDYLKMKNDEKATNEDKTCIKIIENYSFLTNEYAETLRGLLILIRV